MRITRKHAIPLAFAGVSAVALGWVATGAVYGASANANTTSFVSGSVNLTAGAANTQLNMANMAPGDSSVGPVTVTNTGSLEQRYSVVSKTTEDVLAKQLVLTIKSGVTTCTKDGFSKDGAQLYSGALGSTVGSNVIGNPAQGPQAGDRVLAAQASETLCVQVSLPLATGDAYQKTTTNDTLVFNAEQTANNATDSTVNQAPVTTGGGLATGGPANGGPIHSIGG